MLPSRERLLCLQAALWLIGIRLALLALPFETVHHALLRRGSLRSELADPANIPSQRIGWFVDAAGARIPGARCLARALAAELLLRRAGYPAELRIGVARGQRGELVSHAWIESAGRIVIGDLPDLRRFIPLLAPDEHGSSGTNNGQLNASELSRA